MKEFDYTIFPNEILQERFTDDKLPSATEVYAYLQTLPINSKIKVKNVASHYGVSLKYMQSLFKIIIKNDCMVAIKTKDRKGKFSGITYKIIPEES